MDIGDIRTELKILYKDQLGYPLTTCALSCGTANRNGCCRLLGQVYSQAARTSCL
jgi:protein-arginine kinase